MATKIKRKIKRQLNDILRLIETHIRNGGLDYRWLKYEFYNFGIEHTLANDILMIKPFPEELVKQKFIVEGEFIEQLIKLLEKSNAT